MNVQELTEEQVKLAKTNRSHLVSQAIDYVGERHWRELRDKMKNVDYPDVARDVAMVGILPVALVIDQKGFHLNPTDILSIWSRAVEVMPIISGNVYSSYPRHELATAVALAHASYGIRSDKVKGLYLGYMRNGDFSKIGELGESGINHVFHKFDNVVRAVEEIGRYNSGRMGRDAFLDEVCENFGSFRQIASTSLHHHNNHHNP